MIKLSIVLLILAESANAMFNIGRPAVGKNYSNSLPVQKFPYPQNLVNAKPSETVYTHSDISDIFSRAMKGTENEEKSAIEKRSSQPGNPSDLFSVQGNIQGKYNDRFEEYYNALEKLDRIFETKFVGNLNNFLQNNNIQIIKNDKNGKVEIQVNTENQKSAATTKDPKTFSLAGNFLRNYPIDMGKIDKFNLLKTFLPDEMDFDPDCIPPKGIPILQNDSLTFSEEDKLTLLRAVLEKVKTLCQNQKDQNATNAALILLKLSGASFKSNNLLLNVKLGQILSEVLFNSQENEPLFQMMDKISKEENSFLEMELNVDDKTYTIALKIPETMKKYRQEQEEAARIKQQQQEEEEAIKQVKEEAGRQALKKQEEDEIKRMQEDDRERLRLENERINQEQEIEEQAKAELERKNRSANILVKAVRNAANQVKLKKQAALEREQEAGKARIAEEAEKEIQKQEELKNIKTTIGDFLNQRHQKEMAALKQREIEQKEQAELASIQAEEEARRQALVKQQQDEERKRQQDELLRLEEEKKQRKLNFEALKKALEDARKKDEERKQAESITVAKNSLLEQLVEKTEDIPKKKQDELNRQQEEQTRLDEEERLRLENERIKIEQEEQVKAKTEQQRKKRSENILKKALRNFARKRRQIKLENQAAELTRKKEEDDRKRLEKEQQDRNDELVRIQKEEDERIRLRQETIAREQQVREQQMKADIFEQAKKRGEGQQNKSANQNSGPGITFGTNGSGVNNSSAAYSSTNDDITFSEANNNGLIEEEDESEEQQQPINHNSRSIGGGLQDPGDPNPDQSKSISSTNNSDSNNANITDNTDSTITNNTTGTNGNNNNGTTNNSSTNSANTNIVSTDATNNPANNSTPQATKVDDPKTLKSPVPNKTPTEQNGAEKTTKDIEFKIANQVQSNDKKGDLTDNGAHDATNHSSANKGTISIFWPILISVFVLALSVVGYFKYIKTKVETSVEL